jgi:hypothetical protein
MRYGRTECTLIMNTAEEKWKFQREYQLWYQEWKNDALLELQHVANMNATQNGYGKEKKRKRRDR